MNPNSERAQQPDQLEQVNHPRHYTAHPSGVEAIDIKEHLSSNLGDALKYIWRAGLKSSAPTVIDLQKAAWYLVREARLVTLDPTHPSILAPTYVAMLATKVIDSERGQALKGGSGGEGLNEDASLLADFLDVLSGGGPRLGALDFKRLIDRVKEAESKASEANASAPTERRLTSGRGGGGEGEGEAPDDVNGASGTDSSAGD